ADPDDLRARAYLAVALAGGQKCAEAAAALVDLDAAGRSVDDDLPGFGVPAAEVTQAIWDHCWADWTPEGNRRCWQGLFDAFPAGRHAALPASRLLMAALKLHDAPEAARLSAWFDERLEEVPDGADPSRLLHLYAQAYVRAGVT